MRALFLASLKSGHSRWASPSHPRAPTPHPPMFEPFSGGGGIFPPFTQLASSLTWLVSWLAGPGYADTSTLAHCVVMIHKEKNLFVWRKSETCGFSGAPLVELVCVVFVKKRLPRQNKSCYSANAPPTADNGPIDRMLMSHRGRFQLGFLKRGGKKAY